MCRSKEKISTDALRRLNARSSGKKRSSREDCWVLRLDWRSCRALGPAKE